jgi:hypothetical protein
MSRRQCEPFTLVRPGPRLTSRALARLEEILREKFDYAPLPAAYKAFLRRHNGGYVSPGCADGSSDNAHRQEVAFKTPLVWARDGNRPVRPSLVMFFYAWLEVEMPGGPPDDPRFCELIASNAYSRFDFDVLPTRMMFIGKCSHPDAGDMLCLSLNDEDYGCVYYYYDMWFYPADFHGDYYTKRRRDVLARFGWTDESEADLGRVVRTNETLNDALKRVPFVRVADSFDGFLKSLELVTRSA